MGPGTDEPRRRRPPRPGRAPAQAREAVLPGERMPLMSLIRTPDLAQDSMIVWSWYVPKASAWAVHEDWFRRLRTSRVSQWEDYLAGDR